MFKTRSTQKSPRGCRELKSQEILYLSEDVGVIVTQVTMHAKIQLIANKVAQSEGHRSMQTNGL